MKLNDLIPELGKLNLIEGVERRLLQGKYSRNISLITAVAGIIIQILTDLFSDEKYISELPGYFVNFIECAGYLLRGRWEAVKQYQFVPGLTGFLIVAAGFVICFFILLRNLLVKYSEEPFRYTFWIEPFKHVQDKEGETFKIEKEDRFHFLLHHDLMEKLNDRIGRLSLLNEEKLDSEARKNLSSHINITGHFVVRRTTDSERVIHVMPRIRIGPSGNPETLAVPVRFPIEAGIAETMPESVDADQYNQVVERIYSSIATEIYRQIKRDLTDKMKLFPLKYLRAVALFYEAEDFARSNTIDAYDYAIRLYRDAERYFDITALKWITRQMIRYPFFWRFGLTFQHTYARVETGYAKCLIYRKQVSALSGRYMNPLFEVRSKLDEVIESLTDLHNRINSRQLKFPGRGDKHGNRDSWPGRRLMRPEDEEIRRQNRLNSSLAYLTFPRDSWSRRLLVKPDEALFERQRRIYFDAHVVSALAYYYLGSLKSSRAYIDDAKAIAPVLSERNALYLLALAIIEPDLGKKIPIFRQATEAAPDFEMAQYLLAYYSEMRFRMQNEIAETRARSVIDEYEKVLRINPGNIAALSSQGYIYWLLGNFSKAKKKFEEGRGTKAVVSETFIGELNYGLARIASEEGDFEKSYALFQEAIAADPGVGAYTVTAGKFGTTSYFDYIGKNLLKRYKTYKEIIEFMIDNPVESSREYIVTMCRKEKVSTGAVNRVYGFVLNDYGNACLNYFHRYGDNKHLDAAIAAFELARNRNPDNRVYSYNLHNAYMWRNKQGDYENAKICLEETEKRGPAWPFASIALSQLLLRQGRDEIKKSLQEAEAKILEGEDLKAKLRAVPAGSAGAKPEAYEKCMLKAKEQYDKAMATAKEHVLRVLPKVKEIIGGTKLSSVYDGFNFQTDGKGLEGLLRETVEVGRLDENDVDALVVWAEVLSNNFSDDNAQKGARMLCSYIQALYYPEYFNVSLIMSDMIDLRKRKTSIQRKLAEWKGKQPAQTQEQDEETHEYADTIRTTIKSWIAQDHDNYASLSWADGFFSEGDIIEFYKEASGNAVMQNSLGNTFFDKENYTDAVKYYTQAVALDGDRAIYECNLGRAYGLSGKWDDMILHCGRALERRKKTEDSYGEDYYYEYLAEAYFGAGRLDEFEKIFSGYSEQREKAVIYNRIGNMFFEKGQGTEAASYYEKATGNDGSQPIYECNLGRAYGLSGRWDDMILNCGRALERRKKTEDSYGEDYYYGYLAEAYFGADRLDEFEKIFIGYSEQRGKAVIYNRIGNMFFEKGQGTEAASYYQKAIGNDGSQPIYECNLGRAYGLSGRWDDMILHCEKAVNARRDNTADPYGLDYYYAFLAEAYYHAGRLNYFVPLFEKSGDLSNEAEKKAEVYNRIGNLLSGDKHNEEAATYYKKAIGLDGLKPIYECNLGLMYGRMEEWDKMILHCGRAVELRRDAPSDPYSMDYYYEFLAEAYFSAGRLKEFEGIFAETGDFLEFPEKKAGTYNIIGNSYVNTLRSREAVPYYEKAIAIAPGQAVYYYNLGLAHKESGQWEEAEKALQQATTLEPDNAVYQNILGNAYLESGNYEMACGQYEKAVRLDPGTGVYIDNLILACEGLKDPDKAISVLEAVLALATENTGLQQALKRLIEKKNVQRTD